MELDLASYFARPTRVNYRRFVSVLISAAVRHPQLSPTQVDQLSDRARASLRVATAEAAGVAGDFRRMRGTCLSADERLFAAVLYQRQARLRQLTEIAAPPIRSLSKALSGFPRTPLAQSLQRQNESIAKLFRSPAFESIAKAQSNLARLGRSPAFENLQRQKDSISRMFRSPAFESLVETQHKLAGLGKSPLFENLQRQNQSIAKMFRSPAFESLAETQHKLAGLGKSPLFENLQRQNQSIAKLFRSPAFEAFAAFGQRTRDLLGDAFVRSFEAAAAYLDAHWAELETANPDHPPPVLYIVASLPMAVGLPLYEAVKQKADEALLDVLEPVLSDPAFVEELQAAVQQAPHLSEVARRHLVTACDWVAKRSYVDAYPPFYNGLESGFTAVARAANVIDGDNRFQVLDPPATRASKVEDLFPYLPMDARFRRFLRAWIFG